MEADQPAPRSPFIPARPELGDVCSEPSRRGWAGPHETALQVERRLWRALLEVEDPEIPVSVVDMGLIVGLRYDHASRGVALRLTFTAMGCPAMDLIQDDIISRLRQDRAVERVDVEVVWDPVWTPARLSEAARARMRALGIAA